MYVRTYSYRVPTSASEAFLALQRRVADLYLAAGCVKYVVLTPTSANGPWLELSYFPSHASFEAAEAKLASSGQLDLLFTEFLRLTGLREDQVQPTSYEVGLVTPPDPPH